jgi:A/G-specific adenine glycosylase
MKRQSGAWAHPEGTRQLGTPDCLVAELPDCQALAAWHEIVGMRMRKAQEYRPRLDARKVKAFQARLLAWFRQNGRDLPWRRTRDPYKILVSEVMLQQTQVERVREYYTRFLREYPTVLDLAAAHPARVRESWEGLGYYARARNLHAAARTIVRQHEGRFPRHVEDLQALPGVGRYTAGAVVSFAYGEPAPILDTNVRRVLSRIFVRRRASNSAREERRLWALAEVVIPPGETWTMNQALMDFGATVCTARNPKCPICPVRSVCAFCGRTNA